MEVAVSLEIEKSKEEVWKTITDFENCANYIESIVKLEIINQPENTLEGFKWKETRVMFGKEAEETMWITDYTENEYYQTRAESHGSVYTSKLSIEPAGEKSVLTMSFSTEPKKLMARIFSFCLGPLMKGSIKKAFLKDLNDIKKHTESQ